MTLVELGITFGRADEGMKLSTVIVAAHARAKSLGHSLEGWEKDGRMEAFARCQNCGLFANVNMQPQKGDGPVWGSAVEVPCRGEYMTAPTWGRVWNEDMKQWI